MHKITCLLNLPVLMLSLPLGLTNCTWKVQLHATLRRYIISLKATADIMKWGELGFSNACHTTALTAALSPQELVTDSIPQVKCLDMVQ